MRYFDNANPEEDPTEFDSTLENPPLMPPVDTTGGQTVAQPQGEGIDRRKLFAYLQNAIHSRTSRPSDILYKAFTGENPLPPDKPTDAVTPYDLEQQQAKTESMQSESAMRRAQVEKYLADAKKSTGGLGSDWVDTGFRTKEDAPGLNAEGTHNPPRAIYRNKKTGELKPIDLPSGAYEKADLTTALMAMAEEGKNARANAPAGPLTQAEKDKMELENKYRLEQIAKQNEGRISAINAKPTPIPKPGADLSPGERAADVEFGKRDFNEWASSGKGLYEKNKQRLEEAMKELEKSKKDALGPSGRLVGRLPDWMKPEENIRIRDDVRAAAQGSLKATLGAQFTEKEGERIMSQSYNEALSPKENIKKIKSALSEIDKHAAVMDSKSKHFGARGTLKGWNMGDMPAPQDNSGAPPVSGAQYNPVKKRWFLKNKSGGWDAVK